MKRWVVVCLAVLAIGGLAQAQRLPKIAVPEHYGLKFTPDFVTDKFSGEETINLRVLAPTRSITLNAIDLALQEVTVTAPRKGRAQKMSITPHPQAEMVTLEAPETIPAGAADLHIKYTGTLNHKLRGFYLSKAGSRKYAVTQFEPTDARRAFPSFDEPAYKATFDISVVAPAGDTAISNGRIIADEPGPGPKQHTIRFATSPKMSTYLVAVLVGEFQCIQGGADGVPIRVCAAPGQQELGRFALSAAESFLHYYDQYFDIKYPYGKLDLIGIPDFEAGAMENTGAITFRDLALLADEKDTSVGRLKEIALVVSHEMAHQWFGDLVTMEWWNDIWLNEGFATWMETKPVAAWKPEWHMEMDEQESADEAMSADSLQNTRPIRQPAETSAQINELFDEIAYNKAAAVLRMTEAYIGPEVFRRGVNKYLAAHLYGNAAAEDFSRAITEAANKPADRIMASFVNQPGVPVVAGKFECTAPAHVTLSQRRFYYDQARHANAAQSWTVPVCLGAKGAPSQCVLLNQGEQTFKMSAACEGSTKEWNFGARGYYRVAYPANEVTDLGATIESAFSPVGRLAIVDNEWALVRAGSHQIGNFLTLAQGLQNDRTEPVMAALAEHFDYITDYLVDATDREAYQAWVRNLLRPTMQELGWRPKPGDSDERRELRRDVFEALGYSGRDPQALAEARKLVQDYMRNPASVDPTLLATAFHLAALQGDAALYDEFLNGMKAAKAPEAHYRYLGALGDFSDPALLKRTLELALGPEVRGQDAPGMIAGVMANPAGRDLGWQFVRTHWEQIKQKSSIWGAAAMVRVSGSFCDANDGRQVEQFFSAHKVPAAERSLRQSLERIQNCVALKQAQQTRLAAWLKERPGPAAGSK